MSIDGVLITPLKKVVNPRGHLTEVQRADDQHFPGFGQAYVTMTNPGVVKAWYRHHKQIDQIALIKGSLLLVLFDSRGESSTSQALAEIRTSDDSPLLVQIPTGIWHGFQALGSESVLLLHLNTIPFNFDHIDEDRIADDDSRIPYRWSR
ncbi:MAG: dTDP-4-dehydrorhamnose 3,5-epimerase family protein [Bryobacteraceae bacterium]|nr:dTDP-4-dehydrorhamnose 3,5-epimerase family protein [Bryobacteraceae bacterium]